MPGEKHQHDYLRGPTKWQHEFAGRPARVHTDTFDGHHRGKPTWETDEDGVETTIRIERPRARARPNRDAATGTDIDNDAVILFDPDEVDVADGNSENERASIIEDLTTGKRYRVLRIRTEESPLHMADCEDLHQHGDGDE